MQIFKCIFVVLLSLALVSSYDLKRFFNAYMRPQDRNSYGIYRKFGLPQPYMFRPLSLHHQGQPVQMPACLPFVWTCGPSLPPCCEGLMCYDGNAKRGRQCVARG